MKIPPLSDWNMYAGGTFAASDRHGYSLSTDIGNFKINPISSRHNSERHLGYKLSFENVKGLVGPGLHADIIRDLDGEVRLVQPGGRHLFRGAAQAVVAARIFYKHASEQAKLEGRRDPSSRRRRRSARSPRSSGRGGGIYGDVAGIQQDDFVVYRDHRGKFRVDLVTTNRGNHLTIGKTMGEASLEDAIRLAEREAHTRGIGDAVVFALRGDEYVQYGNITHGRFRKGG